MLTSLLPVFLLLQVEQAPVVSAPEPAPAAVQSNNKPDAPFSLQQAAAQQAVVVVVADWSSTVGSLRRFEQRDGTWHVVGNAVDVSVGEGGLAWGLGLHPLGAGEPRKVDGDGRSPAGVFRLGAGVTQGTDPRACVQQPGHPDYNRLVANEGAPSDAKRLTGELYAIALPFDHNRQLSSDKPLSGRGSCSFLHIWRRKNKDTDGGTAMARADLEKVLAWLDASKQPVLVQLPKRELAMKAALWGIPL